MVIAVFFPNRLLPTISMENIQTRRLSSGLKVSQAEEALAAQPLMARALRMWIGTQKTENIECDSTADGSKYRPTRW
jgi:hypothetical protein